MRGVALLERGSGHNTSQVSASRPDASRPRAAPPALQPPPPRGWWAAPAAPQRANGSRGTAAPPLGEATCAGGVRRDAPPCRSARGRARYFLFERGSSAQHTSRRPKRRAAVLPPGGPFRWARAEGRPRTAAQSAVDCPGHLPQAARLLERQSCACGAQRRLQGQRQARRQAARRLARRTTALARRRPRGGCRAPRAPRAAQLNAAAARTRGVCWVVPQPGRRGHLAPPQNSAGRAHRRRAWRLGGGRASQQNPDMTCHQEYPVHAYKGKMYSKFPRLPAGRALGPAGRALGDGRLGEPA